MSREQGAVSVIVIAIVALGIVLAAAVVAGGQLVAARVRAVNAADSAALAAAPVTFRAFGATAGPAAEAGRFATANGADLLACRCPIDRSYSDRIVEVEVRVDAVLLGSWRVAVDAGSAAEFRPTVLLVGSG